MPAFVPDGPDVPERLLQAHEEGRVVFFCGAGISYPAGLPGFRDLVKKVYNEIGRSCRGIEKTAYRRGRYDETFDLLERDLQDRLHDRLLVRKAVARILQPNLKAKGAYDTHKALLDLARDEKGVTRLVTTNFDRIFDHANNHHKLKIANYLAPFLPIPKITKWNGVVYLHGGLLSKKDPTPEELNRIILSSGDFGLAYLSERWASRFVSELLKNFTVCFVGYSIEDPVLRYMMDALAADELLGENRIESFAFASFKNGQRDSMEQKWRAKNVEPLLFNQDSGGSPFAVLHQTIQEWSRVYTTGVSGKRMIVTAHATHPPKTPSRTDYVAGRMLWALTDAKAAKHFAKLNPVPPLKWLEHFDESLFDATDLVRFGVTEKIKADDKRIFSVLDRPSPSTRSRWMSIVSHPISRSNLDEVMRHLAQWLTRHLGNPDLILWIANKGGMLHHDFRIRIENSLSRLRKLEADGRSRELSEIRSNAPEAIPGKAMRKLWQLVLANRLKGHRGLDLYDWFSRLNSEGLTTGLKLELRDLIRPCVSLARPYRWLVDSDEEEDKGEKNVENLVSWEIVLSIEHAAATIRDNQAIPHWHKGLPNLLELFQSLLKEALELMNDLSDSAKGRKLSVLDLPSIESSSQNRDYHEWTVLVSLTRDAWLAVLESDPDRARRIAREWWSEEFLVFKRLALFAVTQGEAFDDAQAVDWLLSEDGRWLWDIETGREALRLLVTIGQYSQVATNGRRKSVQSRLERAILAGPPRELCATEASEEEFIRFKDRQIWLRLEKLSTGSYQLGISSSSRLKRLRGKYPQWKISEDGRDEFAYWIGSGTGAEEFLLTPTSRRDIYEWLGKNPVAKVMQEDDWKDRCQKSFLTVAAVLKYSHKNSKWYPERLSSALYAWAGNEDLLKRSWRRMGGFLSNLSDQQKTEILNALSWWVQAGAKIFADNESCFFSLVNDLVRLASAPKDEPNRDIMSTAINHPIGQATQAVLDWWFRDRSNWDKPISGFTLQFLTKICDVGLVPSCNGRVVLSHTTAWLHRVDPEWAKNHLLPLFDWEVSQAEAKACWTGFLYSPRRDPALLTLVKKPFMETAEHLVELGEGCREAYVRFFTFVALEPAGVFEEKELRAVFERFEVRDLSNAARTLYDLIEGAGEKAAVFWREAIRPFIEKIWPKDAHLRSGQISGHFAGICIAANEEFQDSVEVFLPYLQPVDWLGLLLENMKEKDVHSNYPRTALKILSKIVGEKPRIGKADLKEALHAIGEAEPNLRRQVEFKKLKDLTEE